MTTIKIYEFLTELKGKFKKIFFYISVIHIVIFNLERTRNEETKKNVIIYNNYICKVPLIIHMKFSFHCATWNGLVHHFLLLSTTKKESNWRNDLLGSAVHENENTKKVRNLWIDGFKLNFVLWKMASVKILNKSFLNHQYVLHAYEKEMNNFLYIYAWQSFHLISICRKSY